MSKRAEAITIKAAEKAPVEMIVAGMTEGNDPTFRPEWKENAEKYTDCAVVITKNLTDKLRHDIRDYYYETDGKVIVHATCTGFGRTPIEPNVPVPEKQGDSLCKLILEDGVPADHCVWRADPIIPTDNGLRYFRKSLKALDEVNDRLVNSRSKTVSRVRISVLDNYRHVQDRFMNAGFAPLYNGYWNPSDAEFNSLKRTLIDILKHQKYPVSFELCAEEGLYDRLTVNDACGVCPVSAQGCISEEDLRIMGFPEDRIQKTVAIGRNAQGRKGCHCIACKRELLPARGRCKHNCLYCYWRDDR